MKGHGDLKGHPLGTLHNIVFLYDTKGTPYLTIMGNLWSALGEFIVWSISCISLWYDIWNTALYSVVPF